MMPMIGTFISTKGQDLVDFLCSIGVSKDIASKCKGTQWTLKIFKDCEIWGIYLKCRELPQLNLWNSFVIGEEKRMTHELFGGACKMMCKMNSSSDGFVINIESEKFGKLVSESKFTEDGCTMVLTCKDKSVKGIWERRVKVEGSYVFDHGENMTDYFKAIGDMDVVDQYKHYKLHMFVDDKHYRICEYIGELGRFSNTMELDVETPFRVPGDKEDETPSNRATLSKVGIGKFLLKCKSKSGVAEEWKMCFSKWGLVMTGTEKKTGMTCKISMRRFWEMIGTYKMVSMHGYDKFASTVGCMTLQEAQNMSHDYSTKLIISEVGRGMWRHQLCRRNYPMDYTFRMHQEFMVDHPVLKEEIKMCPTMDDSGTLMMVADTSCGTILHKMYFNNEFCILSVSLPAAHMRYKMIFERMHHTEGMHSCEGRHGCGNKHSCH